MGKRQAALMVTLLLWGLTAIGCAPAEYSGNTGGGAVPAGTRSLDQTRVAGKSDDPSQAYARLLHRYANPPEGYFPLELDRGVMVMVPRKEIIHMANFLAVREMAAGRPSMLATHYMKIFEKEKPLPSDSELFWYRALLYQSYMEQWRMKDELEALGRGQ